jgi:hypothetical protein
MKMQLNLEDVIWDEMAKAHDLTVSTLSGDSEAVTYNVSFSITLDRKAHSELCVKARKRGQRIASFIRCHAAKGLRTCLAAEPDDQTPNK